MFWKTVVKNEQTGKTRVRYHEADTREDAAEQRRKAATIKLNIVSVEQVSEAEYRRSKE